MSRPIDVMIVGAQKAGTTSLLRYLGEHPECISHPQKEFAYFLDTSEYNNSYSLAFNKYFSNKNISPATKIIAKSAGLYVNEKAIQRLYENNPKCEIVFILRNPVDRAYSSYLMEKNYSNVKFEFAELPELIKKHKELDESWGFSFFIDYGLYINYFKKLYKYFPAEQVTILLYDDLKKNASEVCNTIYKKIGVDSDFIPNVAVKHNVTQKNRSKTLSIALKRLLKKDSSIRNFLIKLVPSNKTYKYGELLRSTNKTNKIHENMDTEVRKFLVEFYKPYNAELEKLIGRNLSDWNK